jgi:hypothetical protein
MFVYRSQQRSTYLCTDSTGILHASVSVVAMVCDPFGSLAPPQYSMLSRYTLGGPRKWTIYVLSRIGWLSIFYYTVECRTVTITINRPGYVVFDTASFP